MKEIIDLFSFIEMQANFFRSSWLQPVLLLLLFSPSNASDALRLCRWFQWFSRFVMAIFPSVNVLREELTRAFTHSRFKGCGSMHGAGQGGWRAGVLGGVN